MISKLCLYSAALFAASSIALFPASSANAQTSCEPPVFKYNLLTSIKQDAQSKGMTFDENINPYVVYGVEDGAGGYTLRAVYSSNSNLFWTVASGALPVSITDTTNSYRATNLTVDAYGTAADPYPSSMALGHCLYYGNRLNYEQNYTGQKAILYTYTEESNNQAGPEYWTDAKVQEIMTFIFFAIFDIMFIAWIWHAFTRD